MFATAAAALLEAVTTKVLMQQPEWAVPQLAAR